MTARSMYIYHVNTQGGMVAGFDISPNGQASVFGDSSGTFSSAQISKLQNYVNL